MFAPETYVCDMCGNIHTSKRTLIEINTQDVIQSNMVTSFSNRTYHLCNKNDRCVKQWASTINQKELR